MPRRIEARIYTKANIAKGEERCNPDSSQHKSLNFLLCLKFPKIKYRRKKFMLEERVHYLSILPIESIFMLSHDNVTEEYGAKNARKKGPC